MDMAMKYDMDQRHESDMLMRCIHIFIEIPSNLLGKYRIIQCHNINLS